MLDDLKYIHQRDSDDALGDAERQWKQLQYDFEFDPGELAQAKIVNIVHAGMGGSALAALVSQSWPGFPIPFEVSRQYHLPKYVNDKTLFIANSYSGNTEETLAVLAEAEDRGAQIVVIATGGKLADIAKDKGYALLLFPKVVQPRYALMYALRAIVTIMEALEINCGNPCLEALEKAGDWLKDAVKDWTAVVPTDKNPAKQLAYELAGKSVVVYAGPMLAPAAYKWKINCNENAKNVAWWNQLPEFDHNELMGWTSHPTEKPYAVVELRSKLEHPRIQKRFEVGEKLLSGRRPAPNIIEVQGETLLEQLVWSIAYGDFVTMYLALLNNVNPGTSEVVEQFKKMLDE